MLKIGVSQIKNSTEINENFTSIKKSLQVFEKTAVDLILFPECCLSGFSAKIKDCTAQVIKEYLDYVERWSLRTGKQVILPTALKEQDAIYNTGFFFQAEKVHRFYKLGLTESESSFFSVPKKQTQKVFKVKNYNIALLICFEAEQAPWKYFKEGEVDVILWPGYWGWVAEDTWQEHKNSNEENLIYKNMKQWKCPLIQSNFAYNELEDFRESGPHGLSVFVNNDNQLVKQGRLDDECCYEITVEDKVITNCLMIGRV